MQIKIDKDEYDSLIPSDKLRYIFIRTSKKFKNQILKSRKNLQIPESGLNKNDFNKFVKEKQKEITREVNQIIKNFPILNSNWVLFLKCFIVCEELQFYPSAYSYSADDYGNIIIKLSRDTFRAGSIENDSSRKGFQKGSTQTEFINWIKDNWKLLEMASRLSQPNHIQLTHKKFSYIPEYENLGNIIKIIDGKAKGKSAKDIAKKIDKRELASGQEEKINKAYSRIKNQLKILEKDSLYLLKKDKELLSG